jgi:hypothetical protein
MTIRDILQQAYTALLQSDAARLDAQILLCHVLQVDLSIFSFSGWIL